MGVSRAWESAGKSLMMGGGGRRRTRRFGVGASAAVAFLEASARRPKNPRDTDCILTAASCSALVAFAAAVTLLICRSSAATRSRSAALSASSIFGVAALSASSISGVVAAATAVFGLGPGAAVQSEAKA